MNSTSKILGLILFCINLTLSNAQSLNESSLFYYPFSGDASDVSGNALNGVVNGATLTDDRFGNANSAYSFDGVDDEISIPCLLYTSDAADD